MHPITLRRWRYSVRLCDLHVDIPFVAFGDKLNGSECWKIGHEWNSHKTCFMWIPHGILYVNFTRISSSHEIQVKRYAWNSHKKIHVEFTWKFSHKFHYKCSFHLNIFTWISHAPLLPINKWLGMIYHYCCWSRIAVRKCAQGQIRLTTTVVEVELLYVSVHKVK